MKRKKRAAKGIPSLEKQKARHTSLLSSNWDNEGRVKYFLKELRNLEKERKKRLILLLPRSQRIKVKKKLKKG